MSIKYSPDVEQWRGLVDKHVRLAGKNPADVDKYLWVISGESGGRADALGDNGVAYGLFQIHGAESIPTRPQGYQLLDPEYNIWFAVNQLSWADWGENNLFEGRPFGALGLNPYPGNAEPGTLSAPGNSGGGILPSIPVPGFVRDAAGKIWPDAIDVPGVGRGIATSIPGGGVVYAVGEKLFDVGGNVIGSVGGGLDAVKTSAIAIGKAFGWLLDPHHWFRLFFVFGGFVLFLAGLYVYVRGDKVGSDMSSAGKVAAFA